MDRDAARAIGRATHGSSDDPEVLDFSANVNPEVPPDTKDAYGGAFGDARSYPPEPAAGFREAAAAYVGCEPDGVVPTPGGMAALRLAIALWVEPGASVIVPAPSFAEYAREVRLHGGQPRFVPADELVATDPADAAMAIACTPNNPTGACYPHDELVAFAGRCRRTGTPLLVDEAFLDFTDRPSMAGHDRVIVARSLTKMFGLPGLRAGYAVATGETLAALAGARPPWNVGVPALAVGEHCLEQHEFVTRTRERVTRERRRMRERLVDGYDVAPSAAPFLLVRAPDVDALLDRAAGAGIAIRDARTFRGLESHVRVAVRRPVENDRMLAEVFDV